jgi:hypothetical protein
MTNHDHETWAAGCQLPDEQRLNGAKREPGAVCVPCEVGGPCETCGGGGRVTVGPWGIRPETATCEACGGSGIDRRSRPRHLRADGQPRRLREEQRAALVLLRERGTLSDADAMPGRLAVLVHAGHAEWMHPGQYTVIRHRPETMAADWVWLPPAADDAGDSERHARAARDTPGRSGTPRTGGADRDAPIGGDADAPIGTPAAGSES